METIAVVSANQVAQALDVSGRDAASVIASGLAGDVFQAETGQRFVKAGDLEKIVTRSDFVAVYPAHPWLLHVRVRPAQPVDEGVDTTRNFVGWQAGEDRATNTAGVDRWWRVRDPELLKTQGALLVATIAGFVVHVGKIEDYTRSIGGLVRFVINDELTAGAPEVADLEETRLRGRRGGPTLLIPPGNS